MIQGVKFKQIQFKKDNYIWYGWVECKGVKPGTKFKDGSIANEVYSIVLTQCPNCGSLLSDDVVRCIDCKEKT